MAEDNKQSDDTNTDLMGDDLTDKNREELQKSVDDSYREEG